MTVYERTQQLERRKTIAAGIVGVAIAGMILSGCCMVASNADKGIDEMLETENAIEMASEAQEFEFVCVDADIVAEPTEVATEVETEAETETETEIEIEIETEVVTPSYTNKEYEELAHMIWAEAGNQSEEAMYAVGSVILNRVKSKRFPNSIHKVLYQKGQYSPARHGFMKRKPSKKVYRVAKDLLEHGSTIPSGVLGQASKSIYKKYGKKLYKRIGKIYFFYLK